MTSCGPPKLTGPDMCEMEAGSETQHSLHNPVKPSVGWGWEGAILVEFISLVFTRMRGGSYRRRFRPLT